MSDGPQTEQELLEELRTEIAGNSSFEEEEKASVVPLTTEAGSVSLGEVLVKDGTPSAEESADIRAQLANMTLPQKLKVAMFGNATCRTLLIGDSNKIIQMAVLKNPKLKVKEVEEFARNKNLSDTVLRTISNKREWISDYSVKLGLVWNPRCPQDVSLKWLRYLRTSDLKGLAKSKEVPQVVTTLARKRLAEAQKRK